MLMRKLLAAACTLATAGFAVALANTEVRDAQSCTDSEGVTYFEGRKGYDSCYAHQTTEPRDIRDIRDIKDARDPSDTRRIDRQMGGTAGVVTHKPGSAAPTPPDTPSNPMRSAGPGRPGKSDNRAIAR